MFRPRHIYHEATTTIESTFHIRVARKSARKPIITRRRFALPLAPRTWRFPSRLPRNIRERQALCGLCQAPRERNTHAQQLDPQSLCAHSLPESLEGLDLGTLDAGLGVDGREDAPRARLDVAKHNLADPQPVPVVLLQGLGSLHHEIRPEVQGRDGLVEPAVEVGYRRLVLQRVAGCVRVGALSSMIEHFNIVDAARGAMSRNYCRLVD